MMKNKLEKKTSFLLLVAGNLIMIILSALCGCKGKNNGNTGIQKPAEVINQVKENTLTTIHLTAEAEKRLGIETQKVELKTIPRKLELGGEIVAPPGQDVKVIAPVNGTVIGTEKNYFPVAGSLISKGQAAMRIAVLPPEIDRISAAEDLKVKQAEYDAALAEFKRSEKLMDNNALSEKNYESAKVGLVKAEALLKAAKSRSNLYLGIDSRSDLKDLSTYLIESPISGIIQNVYITQGQSIPASSVLFEVTPADRFWVKVPVYSGDLIQVDQKKEAYISITNTGKEPLIVTVRPVSGPQRSDPANVSSDLYYEVENREGIFRIGQKIMVTLMLKNSGENMVVPYSSILYDMYGSNWVYVKSEPLEFIRKRVELSHVEGKLAVLLRGVSPGEEVVFNGAAELYGTEFGGGK